jgi:hypothetical protein
MRLREIIGLAATLLGLTAGGVIGCGEDVGGAGDGGAQLTSGVYVASAARNLLDQCNQDPNNAQSPLEGSTFLLDVDGGTVLFYGAADGGLVGTPPQPAQGQGTVSNGQGVLTRENDTTSASCSYHLKVQNSILVTGPDQFTSAYERTETNHTGTCPPNRPDGCVTSFNWDLRKQ